MLIDQLKTLRDQGVSGDTHVMLADEESRTLFGVLRPKLTNAGVINQSPIPGFMPGQMLSEDALEMYRIPMENCRRVTVLIIG